MYLGASEVFVSFHHEMISNLINSVKSMQKPVLSYVKTMHYNKLPFKILGLPFSEVQYTTEKNFFIVKERLAEKTIPFTHTEQTRKQGTYLCAYMHMW